MDMKGHRSPWGTIQHSKDIGRGMTDVSTARHGGVKLDREANQEIPKPFRNEGGWYEEDCEISIPLYFLHDSRLDPQWRGNLFDGIDEAGELEKLSSSLKDWFPHKWEAHFGTPVPEGDSRVLRRERFEYENLNRYVVRCAWGDGHDKVPKGMVGCYASLLSDGNDGKWVLVPKERYDARSEFGYVVQPDDAEWKDHAA